MSANPHAEHLQELLEGLNEPQREAVTHGEGPLLILAGAGSGKTLVLTHRIAYLIYTDMAQAGEILAITFTNKAAKEMSERVKRLLGRDTRGMWLMTFHAACARILRAEAARLGYTRQFTIYDQADSRRLTKRSADAVGVDLKRFTPAAIHNQISAAKNRLLAATDYRETVASPFEEMVADVYDIYERDLHRMNAMDFDDLLFRTVNLLELFEDVRERYVSTFRHVLVDEYQDTNRAQYRLLQLLVAGAAPLASAGAQAAGADTLVLPGHRNLAVVGDDSQCLVSGTLVTMADGNHRAIEQIQIGDRVLSSFGSGIFRPAAVTDVFESHRTDGIRVRTRAGREILSTPEHTHFAGYRNGVTPSFSFQHPHHTWQRFEGKRPDVVVTLGAMPTGSDRSGQPLHAVATVGRDLDSRDQLERMGFRVKPARDGARGWRSETYFNDFGDAVGAAERLRSSLDAATRWVARLGNSRPGQTNALPFAPASSIRPGMAMFDEDGGYDVVVSVERVTLDQPVYDINIADTHNFIAAGLITHNSIYSFRGADVKNILDFQDDFEDARIVKLEQNYRSTGTILQAANAVIANNRGGIAKRLWSELGQGEQIHVRVLEDEHAEARFVVGEIERLVDEGAARAEIAVLYRTNAMSRVIEDALVRREIAYQVIGGTKFYERAEIKDAIAYLALLANPFDVVGFTRVVNSPRRGIGQTSVARVLAHAEALGVSVWEAASRPEEVPGLGAAAIKALARFMDAMKELQTLAGGPVDASTDPGGETGATSRGVPVGDLIEALLTHSGYIEALEAERTIEAQGRIENLQELIEVGHEFDARVDEERDSLGVFLQEIALVADADARSDEEGLVTLMTAHNAKGLEYPTIFVTGLEDGVFPHSRALEEGALEEERRLFYVAVTRAMRQLYLTHARRRAAFGAQTYGMRSRFLDEIPADLLDEPLETMFRPGAISARAGVRRAASSAEPGGAVTGGWRGASETGLGAGERPAASAFRLGEDVIHAAFGDGVITGVEPGGVIVVRFADDGSERKLMADYAPVSRR
ncbi:MAG TPA: UvrD-helicase domain-containing protein [Solirubrobacteraceae bacterium]|jgi:superfamily I DNA/RNA helicase|nr:UvrD-helicase domain-containing protein [Solirubrobacteraceae bacterium]